MIVWPVRCESVQFVRPMTIEGVPGVYVSGKIQRVVNRFDSTMHSGATLVALFRQEDLKAYCFCCRIQMRSLASGVVIKSNPSLSGKRVTAETLQQTKTHAGAGLRLRSRRRPCFNGRFARQPCLLYFIDGQKREHKTHQAIVALGSPQEDDQK